MQNWLIKNKSATTLGETTMLVILTLASISGCQVDDFIKFEPPEEVQAAIGVDASVPMSKADVTWDEWEAYVDKNSSRLAAEIEDGNYRLGMIQSLTDMGFQALNDVAPGIPGGALLVGGLSMMGGLFLKKPGSDKAVAREKEQSYVAGLAEGKKIAIQLYETAKAADLVAHEQNHEQAQS